MQTDETDVLDMPQWHALNTYAATMEGCIAAWKHVLQTACKLEHMPTTVAVDWVDRVLKTIKLLRNEYVYDSMRTLGVYPVGSGFPERTHIQLLMQLHREGVITRSTVTEQDFRRSFLDQLFQQRSVNYWMLERIAKAHVKKTLQTVKPVGLFCMLGLEQIGTINGRMIYRCRFERYCYRHIPSLYTLVFECSEPDGINDTIMAELLPILEEETSQLPLLGSFAEKVDQAHALIHPKWVGRLVLGPVFISGVTKDNHELQRVLDAAYAPEQSGAVSRIIYEYIVSEKVVQVSRLFDAVGRKHPELQQFAVRQFDTECLARKVTYVEKHLFAPHAIVQRLSDHFRSEIGHTIQIQGEET